MKKLLILILFSALSFAQTVYEIPFASRGNLIELEVTNSLEKEINSLNVTVKSKPDWVEIEEGENAAGKILLKKSSVVNYKFDVDREAPIRQTESIIFKISDAEGNEWEKTISIEVGTPEKFEVYQNYPNPFNPSTTIAYQLNQKSTVKLIVFNLLGQQVKTLVDDIIQPGYHKSVWDASGLASGIYFYVLRARDFEGKTYLEQKKMLLLK